MKFKDTKYGNLTNNVYETNLYVNNKQLTSLEGCPSIVNGNFNCSNNELESLKGLENTIVNGVFDCSNNFLKTLDFFPKSESLTNLEYNKIISLKGLPKEIIGYLNLNNNELTSLEDSPEIIKGTFNCNSNKLTSLKGNLKKIEGDFFCRSNINLKNPKQQIIENQIEAENYYTDYGSFKFEDIKEEFENYGKFLLKKEQLRLKKENYNKEKINKKNIIRINKKLLNQKDYGLSL